MYIATDGTHTAVIQKASNVVSPRERPDKNPLTKMICWYQDYPLGDRHHYVRVVDFLRSLVCEYVTEYEFLLAVKSGKMENLRMVKSGDFYQIHRRYVDLGIEYWVFTGWSATANLHVFPTTHFFNFLLRHCSVSDLLHLCSLSEELVMAGINYHRPTHMLSLVIFDRNIAIAYKGSGTIGFVYVTKKLLKQIKGALELSWKEVAREVIREEVAEYSSFLTGNTYELHLYSKSTLLSTTTISDFSALSFSEEYFRSLLGNWHPELSDRFLYSISPTFNITEFLASHKANQTIPQHSLILRKVSGF